MKGKIIISLIFAFSATISHSQSVPPVWTTKTHSFVSTEFQLDSSFTEKLNIIMDSKITIWSIMPGEHIYIHFEKKDSLIYCIEISPDLTPGKMSSGFFEYNGYFYWIYGEIPPNIVLKTKSKRQFSYTDPIPAPFDPPFWYFIYNLQTGSLEEVKEENCY